MTGGRPGRAGRRCGSAPPGREVAFGTDSRGSSPDLDVTREVAAAREAHGERANVRALVRAAVKGGHRALGLMPPQVRRGGGADGLVVWC